MPIHYESIVPWGRSFEEYREMFQLSETELDLKILGCGDGPAAFNARMTCMGKTVVSIDPVYDFSASEIERRIQNTFFEVMEQTEQAKENFVWTKIRNLSELGSLRMEAMREFLSDYPQGLKENRYVPGELPLLPFQEKQFDLALSSHFLFLYSRHLSLDFHLRSLEEILRVAREVRIFPVLNLNGEPSEHLRPVMNHFELTGYRVEKIRVSYEFQKGGNEMLRIREQI